jgi:hypothetical protein
MWLVSSERMGNDVGKATIREGLQPHIIPSLLGTSAQFPLSMSST